MPWICSCQTQRSNVPATRPTEYYRKNITFPFLDELDGEFCSWFDAASVLYLLPCFVRTDPVKSCEKVLKFAISHEEDLPENQGLVTITAEL